MSDSKASQRRVLSAERRRKAIELRLAGATFDGIGRALGITRQSAHEQVMKALDESRSLVDVDANRLRHIELERLDAMQARLWGKTGEPRVADTVLRIMERRALLLGLEAPKELRVTHDPGDAIERLSALVARRLVADGAASVPVKPDGG